MPDEMSRLVEQRLSSLLGHVFFGLLMAAAISAFALVIFGVEAVSAMSHGANRWKELREIGVSVVLVLASYFAAGVVGAVAVWLLRPLRRNIIGWILTSVVTVVVIYGAVGLSSVIGYIHMGVSLVDYDSPEEAWNSLPGFLLAVSLAVGIPVGIYGWWRSKHGLSFFD